MQTESATQSKKLQYVTYTLPAYWASYLINGDVSGGREIRAAADAFMHKHQLPAPVSCSDESWFAKSNDAGTIAGDVMEFFFLIEAKPGGGLLSFCLISLGFIVAN